MSEIKCENCGKDFETERQLLGHQMTCRPKELRKEDRQARVPFHRQKKQYGAPEKEDGYVYRRFNDNWSHDPDRIKRAARAGWETVQTDQQGKTVGTNERGTEIKGVLMRIPKEIYDQDQADKMKRHEATMRQIKTGNYEKASNDNRYLPGGGIQIETSNTP